MRVLAYADSLEFSGAERAFTLLVQGLAARGDFELSACAPPGRLADELRARGLTVHSLPEVPVRAGLTAFDPRLRARARAAAGSSHAELALVNLPSAEAGTAGLTLGLPSVASLHIANSLADAGFRLGAVRDRLAAPRVRSATRIVVPAPSVRRHLWQSWGVPAERVSWAPEAFVAPEAVPRASARERLGLPEDRRVVGIVGRLSVKQKGHDVLLGALARMDPSVVLAVAGAGHDEDRVRSLARELGLASRVTLLGPLARPEQLYGAVDALAIPSRFEGLPLVALEALSLGVPGIASAVDGLEDLWPAAWLVPPGDAASLAAALSGILAGDPAALRARARSHWAEVEPLFGRGTVEHFAHEMMAAREAGPAPRAARAREPHFGGAH